MRIVDGLDSEVLPQPYHMPARPTPRRVGPAAFALNASAAARARAQRFAQRFQTGFDANAGAENLAGYGRRVARERIGDAKLERIDTEPQREFVEQLLLRDRHLRHAEAAECAGRHAMRMDRARQRTVMRNDIRPRRVNRDAVRNCRSPRGISAGIEVAGEIDADEFAVAVGADTHADRGGMTLCGRGQQFRPAVGHRDGAIEMPRGDRDKRLDGKIELGAETAADCRRNNAHVAGAMPRIAATSSRSM